MSLTIRINPLDPDSIDKAVRDLAEYRKKLNARITKFTAALAEIGRQRAEERFASAEYDGNNDVRVTADETENGWVINADGAAVCFIEFGAGIHYNTSNANYPANRPLGLSEIGTYGKRHGSEDSWKFIDETGLAETKGGGKMITTKSGQTLIITHGNPAFMPMYYASNLMRQEIVKLAKEIFSDA